MAGIVLFIITMLGGAMMGVIIVVAIGIRREERGHTLTCGTSDTVCLGARQLTGTCIRMPVRDIDPHELAAPHPACNSPANP